MMSIVPTYVAVPMHRKATMAGTSVGSCFRSVMTKTRLVRNMRGTTMVKNFVAALVGPTKWSVTSASVIVSQLGYQKNRSAHKTPTYSVVPKNRYAWFTIRISGLNLSPNIERRAGLRAANRPSEAPDSAQLHPPIEQPEQHHARRGVWSSVKCLVCTTTARPHAKSFRAPDHR